MSDEEISEQKIDPPARIDLAAETGGYYTIRSNATWAMIRCCCYLDRPAQADMLSVDLWWRGANILADPGTYSYNSAPPWNNGLSLTGAHNTVEIDRLDQMERGPRFTWFHWNRGKVIRHDTKDKIKIFEGEHDGYRRRRGIIHRRAVMMVDEKLWIIIDDIKGEGAHHLSSQWLFPKSEIESRADGSIKLRSPSGDLTLSFFTFTGGKSITPRLEIVCGSTDSTRGWFSGMYLHRERALSVISNDRCALPARRAAIISLAEDVVIAEANCKRFVVSFDGHSLITEWRDLSRSDSDSILSGVRLEKEIVA